MDVISLQEAEEDGWWDFLSDAIATVVELAIEIAIEVAIEITPAKYVVAAYRVIKAVSEGNYVAALEAATELLPLAKHLRNASKLVDVAEKAEKLNRAAQHIKDACNIIDAVVREDWQTVQKLIGEKIKEKTIEGAANKINKHKNQQANNHQQIPPKPNKIVVHARVDKFKDKYNIVENDGKLEIPEREPEKEPLLLDNTKETPKEKIVDKGQADKEKPENKNTNPKGYKERLEHLNNNKNYLPDEDKATLEKLSTEKTEGKVGDTEKTFKRLEDAVKANKGSNPITQVIEETKSNQSNYTSKFSLTEDEAIEAGLLWVGNKYTEVDEGIYLSDTPNSDGTYNQYRMEKASLAGAHSPHVAHVHLEIVKKEITFYKTIKGSIARPPKFIIISNNHIPIIKNK